MDNIFDETRRAVSQAKSALRAADQIADDMAELLRGRLHHVSKYRLVALKRELSRFNAGTKTWKESP